MNNKGFTLVELLTTLVILGILMIVSVPTVIGLIAENEKNTYVSDAKKLIANAEYIVRTTNDDNFRKPYITDHCIVITLAYMESPDFFTAPGGGSYDVDHSFVVVKSQGYNNFLYYASLVEKINDNSYKGVYFASEADLSKKDAKSIPDGILKDKLIDPLLVSDPLTTINSIPNGPNCSTILKIS